jgi:hypothetical protein
MFSNSINARKMISSLQTAHAVPALPESPLPKKQQKKVVVEDYPYETSDSESTDSEEFVAPKKVAKKVVRKQAPKKEKKNLPQPVAPPGHPVQEKVKAPEVVAAVQPSPAPVAQGGTIAPQEKSAKTEPVKKAKRAPSAYNKFASEKMKAGMSMKDVAAAWKAEKEKQSK